MTIRSLSELWSDANPDKRQFAADYAGAFEPPTAPHLSHWGQADRHWVDFNTVLLGCRELNPYPRGERIRRCEDMSQLILWVLVLEPHRMCPECKRGASLGRLGKLVPPDIVEMIEAQAADVEIPKEMPNLGQVIAASLTDAYPSVPHKRVAKAAAALFDHVRVAVHHQHTTRPFARAVAQLLAADLGLGVSEIATTVTLTGPAVAEQVAAATSQVVETEPEQQERREAVADY